MITDNLPVIAERENVRLLQGPDCYVFEVKLPWAPNNIWNASFTNREDAIGAIDSLNSVMTKSAGLSCMLLLQEVPA